MTRDSKIPAILFAATLAMGLVVVGAWLIGESDSRELGEPAATDWLIPHARYPTMEKGGTGLGRNGPVFWLGCAFGLLQLVFFTSCLLLGMKKRRGWGPAARPLLLGGLGWAMVWTGLYCAYYPYMTEAGGGLVLGLPAATAWMLYGAWPYPMLFAVYFVYVFPRWFLQEEDMRRYRHLLRERKAEGAANQE